MQRLLRPALVHVLLLASCDPSFWERDAASYPTGDNGDIDNIAVTCALGSVVVSGVRVAEALQDNAVDHEADGDYVYDASAATQIALEGTSATVDGAGVTVSNGRITVSEPGTYVVRGTLSDGQLVVDSPSEGTVQLVFDGVSISRSSGSAVRIDEADKAVLVLAEGSSNVVSDGATYASDVEQNAAIWSDDDLSIGGSGALTVTASFEDGIASKDGLVIAGGTLTVTAPDEGIRGKDYLVIRDGVMDITAGGDGLKSDEDEDPGLGYVLIEGGTLLVDAHGDAVSAQTDLLMSGGVLSLASGGGAYVTPSDDHSAKGFKAGVLLVMDDGDVALDASDDSVHSDGDVVINGGLIDIHTGDDGVHAEGTLTVNGGTLRVFESYEGVESVLGDLIINGGVLDIVASDDGMNLSGDGDDPNGVESAGDPYDMVFNGGFVSVASASDGLDSNGSMVMTGGCVSVSGPTPGTVPEQGAIDYNGDFEIHGGLLVAAGAAGRMAQTPGSASTQPTLALTFTSEQAGDSVVVIDSGVDRLGVSPTKAFQSLVISAPWLTSGASVSISTNGSLTGDPFGGLSDGAGLVAGTEVESVSAGSGVTAVNL